MKVLVLVSSFHSFSSSKFVIGRLLFVLAFHVGLYSLSLVSLGFVSSFPRSHKSRVYRIVRFRQLISPRDQWQPSSVLQGVLASGL